MSVIVTGIEMPKKCEQCWFFGTDSARVGYCYLLKGELPLPDGVPQDCPLIEVPTPHGRLIDADELQMKLLTAESGKVYDYCYPCKEVLQAIKDSPTIIERETN